MRIYDELVEEYRCPDSDCGFGVSKDWRYCPYCGQKLTFKGCKKSLDDSIEM